MIRTIIKLAVVAVALYALAHVASVYWDHYQFQDSVQELAQFSENASVDQVRTKVMNLANARDIPLDPADLTVTHANHKTVVTAKYTREVVLLPNYSREWNFDVHVVVFTLN
jgi:uncharacterized protein DUF4845